MHACTHARTHTHTPQIKTPPPHTYLRLFTQMRNFKGFYIHVVCMGLNPTHIPCQYQWDTMHIDIHQAYLAVHNEYHQNWACVQ